MTNSSKQFSYGFNAAIAWSLVHNTNLLPKIGEQVLLRDAYDNVFIGTRMDRNGSVCWDVGGILSSRRIHYWRPIYLGITPALPLGIQS